MSRERSAVGALYDLAGWLRSIVPYLAAIVLVSVSIYALAAGPKWSKVFVLSSIFAAMLGYVPVSKITAWLWSPDLVYLLVVDATDIDGSGVELHELTESEWGDLDVTEGTLTEVPALAPLYLCRDFDEEALECRATWRGTMDDLELLQAEQRIEECRGQLEDMARTGMTLRVQLPSIVRRSVLDTTAHIVYAIETGSLPDGDAISRAIDGALPADLSVDIGSGQTDLAAPSWATDDDQEASDDLDLDDAPDSPDPADVEGGVPADD
jgi:hypothetical protein